MIKTVLFILNILFCVLEQIVAYVYIYLYCGYELVKINEDCDLKRYEVKKGY